MAKVEVDPLEIIAEFSKKVISRNAGIFLGIDPGASGAIAFMCEQIRAVIDIPTIKVEVQRTKQLSDEDKAKTGRKTKRVDGTSTKFNHSMICRVFGSLQPLQHRIIVALEEAPVTTGPGRHYADVLLNRSYAMWPLFLNSRSFSVEEVLPAKWKRALGLFGKDKNWVRHKAMSMFPEADILLVQDHNRAEALLLAHYLQQRYQAEKS